MEVEAKTEYSLRTINNINVIKIINGLERKKKSPTQVVFLFQPLSIMFCIGSPNYIFTRQEYHVRKYSLRLQL